MTLWHSQQPQLSAGAQVGTRHISLIELEKTETTQVCSSPTQALGPYPLRAFLVEEENTRLGFSGLERNLSVSQTSFTNYTGFLDLSFISCKMAVKWTSATAHKGVMRTKCDITHESHLQGQITAQGHGVIISLHLFL
jgi:hypothetical protein